MEHILTHNEYTTERGQRINVLVGDDETGAQRNISDIPANAIVCTNPGAPHYLQKWVFAPPLCITSALEDQCYEDATIEAAEICGPNSHEYDSLVESISERLFNERQPA